MGVYPYQAPYKLKTTRASHKGRPAQVTLNNIPVSKYESPLIWEVRDNQLARVAKKHGTLVSFDLNHRASFWKDREKDLRELFTEIASMADILVGLEIAYRKLTRQVPAELLLR